jgi:hypothetical protein
LMRASKVEREYLSGLAFYTMQGVPFGKRKHKPARTTMMTQPMTPYHMGVCTTCHHCHQCHQQLQQQKQQEQASNSGGSTCHGHTGIATTTTPVDAAIDPITPHTLYSEIQGLPLDKNSLHDIHLRFEVPDIWTILSASVNVDNSQLQQQQRQQQLLRLDPVSKDVSLPPWQIKGLNIKVTVHRTNTVSIVVGCSYAPVATDVGGLFAFPMH